MRYITVVIFLFICKACLPPEPDMVKIVEPGMDSTWASIMVSVTEEQKVYIGNKEISSSSIDSILRNKINSFRAKNIFPTVVINADSAANYGIVFAIMRAAKKAGAKVVANSK